MPAARAKGGRAAAVARVLRIARQELALEREAQEPAPDPALRHRRPAVAESGGVAQRHSPVAT